jgi:hypothetical protein
MTRTRLSFALGLALVVAGCPAQTPPPAFTSGGESLGTPEAGSATKKGAPVAPPAAAPAETPAAAPPADKPADKPADAPADKPAEAPKTP